MREVAIVGAGTLGGTLALILAGRDVVSRIRLIDEVRQVATGTALDIMQAAPLNGGATFISGSQDLTMVAGSSVVVVADRADGGEWEGDGGLLLLETVARTAPSSIVLCAGASQRELVERGVREVHFPRTRLFGSAPEALRAALRAVIALEVDGSPRDVSLSVLGIPPDQTVVPWEDVTIGGLAAASRLDEPTMRRIAARVGPLWPPGPAALAAAGAEAVSALFGRSHRELACFVAPDDSSGRRERAVALPVRVGPPGLTISELPALEPRARVAFNNARLL
jgi:malate dehydrogenase